MTTRTKLPTTCIDCSTKLHPRNRASAMRGAGEDYVNMCVSCYDYAGWENTHSDNAHDENNIDPICPVCQDLYADMMTDEDVEIADAAEPVVTGRKNMSHAECSHERTPKARAACRKANAK